METEAPLVTQKIPSAFYMCLCSLSHQPAKRLNCFRTQRTKRCADMIFVHFVLVKASRCYSRKKNGNCSEKRGQLKYERLYSPQQHHVPSAAPHAVRVSSTRDFWVHAAALGQWKHKINSAVTIHSSKALLHTYRTSNVFSYNHLMHSCHFVRLPGTSFILTLISVTGGEDSWLCMHTSHLPSPPIPSSLSLPSVFLFADVQCGSS